MVFERQNQPTLLVGIYVMVADLLRGLRSRWRVLRSDVSRAGSMCYWHTAYSQKSGKPSDRISRLTLIESSKKMAFESSIHRNRAASFCAIMTIQVAVASGQGFTIINPYKGVDGAGPYPNWYGTSSHTHTLASGSSGTVPQLFIDAKPFPLTVVPVNDKDFVSPDPGSHDGQYYWPGYEEITTNQHIVCLGCTLWPGPRTSNQGAIDAMHAQGGMAILAHPSWGPNFWSPSDIVGLNGFDGIEVANGQGYIGWDLWDAALSAGRKVIGTAGNDLYARGYAEVMFVNAPDPSMASILANFKIGNFYASDVCGTPVQGCTPGHAFALRVTQSGNTLTAAFQYSETDSTPQNPAYITWKCGYPTAGSTCGVGASYTITGNEGYVRALFGNPAYGPMRAWSQPIYVIPSGAPDITLEPQNATETAGQTATFSVTASGTGILSYQWQSEAPAGSNFANITGAVNATYTTPATQVSDSGTQLRCVVTNSGGSVTSNAVTLAVLSQGSDTIWVEDSLPAGAGSGYSDGGDAWTWVGANPTPYSGSLASQSNIASGEHQHYFNGATATLSVNTGDALFAYVYTDPANPPSEVMLQWNDGTWEHRAYWGSNQIPWGIDGTVARTYMGPLPATGQWVRLSVSASAVGLEQHVLTGMAFTLYGGRATWDHAGKSASGAPPQPPPNGTTYTIWSPSDAPTSFAGADNPVTLGVRFTSDINGSVTGIRFYKSPQNVGTHTGQLWDSNGTLLAQGTFTNETASGWQQLTFASPVAITANTTYVASYFDPGGYFAVNQYYFANSGHDNPPLHALQANGVYVYSNSTVYPTFMTNSTNFWVDVVVPAAAAPPPPRTGSAVLSQGSHNVCRPSGYADSSDLDDVSASHV
jgi:hypothetical protein